LSNSYGMPCAVDLFTFFRVHSNAALCSRSSTLSPYSNWNDRLFHLPITSSCTKLRHLVNHRALEVRIPIYNLINQSISLLHSLHSCMTHCSTKIQVSKDLQFFSCRIHFFIYMTTSNLLLRCWCFHMCPNTCCVSSKKNLCAWIVDPEQSP
jgi:hypothetical protein